MVLCLRASFSETRSVFKLIIFDNRIKVNNTIVCFHNFYKAVKIRREIRRKKISRDDHGRSFLFGFCQNSTVFGGSVNEQNVAFAFLKYSTAVFPSSSLYIARSSG